MKEYVVIHTRLFDLGAAQNKVLLIHKRKPAWQAGRLNLLGGKVEEGEDAIACAIRELKEESGLEGGSTLLCGSIVGNQSLVHCVRIDVSDSDLSPGADEIEKVEWFNMADAIVDERLMPNLQIIIPLMHMGVVGWQVIDQKSSLESTGVHDVTVHLPIRKPFENEAGK